MYIKALIWITFGTVLMHAVAYADDDDAIVGQWLTQEKEARFEISKSKEKYCGKIVWLKEPTYPAEDEEAGKPKRDRNNPDGSKRNRLIVGLQILNDFTYAGRDVWTNGTIYNPEDGKTYKAKLTLKDSKTLHVRGYIGVSLLGRTTVWTRYEKPKEGEKEGEAKQ